MVEDSLVNKIRKDRPLLFMLLAIGLGGAIGIYASQSPSIFEVLAIIAGLIFLATAANYLEIGLYTLIFITYIRLSDIAIHYHGAPSIAKPFIAFLLMAVISRWVLTRVAPQGWGTPLALVSIYGLVIFISLFYASNFSSAAGVLENYIKDAIIIVVIVMMMQQKHEVRWAIWSFLAAGIFLGFLSSFQFLTGSFSNNFGGFAQSNLQNIIGTSESERIAGPIGDPNFYAQIMVFLCPLAFNQIWIEKKLWLKGLAALAFGLCAATVLFTFSRGGFLALAVAMGFALLYRRPRLLEILLLLAVGVAMLRFIPESYMERMSTVTDLITGKINPSQEVSFRGRASELIAALQMFRDNPILGVGVGNYPTFYQEYSRQIGLDTRSEARYPHNLYIEIAAETGLAGILAFGAIIVITFRSILKANKKFLSTGYKNLASMSMSIGFGLMGYLAAAVFVHGAYQRYLWLIVGVAMALPQVAEQEDDLAEYW